MQLRFPLVGIALYVIQLYIYRHTMYVVGDGVRAADQSSSLKVIGGARCRTMYVLS